MSHFRIVMSSLTLSVRDQGTYLKSSPEFDQPTHDTMSECLLRSNFFILNLICFFNLNFKYL
jgi:hypothetical protein